MNFYPHHISDFNNATRHLTRVERSVYRDAIEMYYDTESVLTGDLTRLQKKLLCRSDEEKQALNDVLDEFFDLHDDGYFHERCDHEIAKYRANISSKAKAGIASAKARKQKAAERKQNSTRVKYSSTLVHNQEPITNNQERGGKAKRFIPPTLQEVKTYCEERNNAIDPEAFIDFYTTSDWMRGKNKIKDWKSCVRTWEKRDGKPGKQQTKNLSDGELFKLAESLSISTMGKSRYDLIGLIDSKGGAA